MHAAQSVPINAISRSVLESDDVHVGTAEPILQCVQIKSLNKDQGGQERFRVVFSDMHNFVQTMLATRKIFA